MRDQPLNPVMVARAVELWKRALANPVYNNLRPGEFDLPSMMANRMMASRPRDNTPEKLEAFGVALAEGLNTPKLSSDKSFSYYENHISVDYAPCPLLQAAAVKASLTMEFPIKTNMSVYDDYVGFSMGYATPNEYHYSLPDGRWLVTTLYGNDISKIIEKIMAGVDIGLVIEA